jgi:hypothetical protein
MTYEIAWSDKNWFLSVEFCDVSSPPPLTTTLHELKTRIREVCANTDQEILHNVWHEAEYRFDVTRTLVALTLNFINDKLLFMKLLQFVFQLVRVL